MTQLDATRPPDGGPPRISPGDRAQIGLLNAGIVRVIGLAAGGAPPNVFTTLARHRRLFRRWLRFAGAMMPAGKLRREDTELLILRVAHNTQAPYEWAQHSRIALTAGLTDDDVERVREGPEATGWTPHQALLLLAADELHASQTLTDATWTVLERELSTEQLIELCLLVGHYTMLAMTLNALRVVPDPPPKGMPRALGALQRRLNRRRDG
jgi:alkylhydroperoxidase family enzyme